MSMILSLKNCSNSGLPISVKDSVIAGTRTSSSASSFSTDFSSIVQNLRSRWEYMDIREKQQVLKSIINKIKIKDETVELQLLI